MDTREIIELIRDSERRTPVKVYINGSIDIDFPGCKVFPMGIPAGCSEVQPEFQKEDPSKGSTECSTESLPQRQFSKIVFGDWKVIAPILEENRDGIINFVVEDECLNSAVPLLEKKYLNARIEPGAIIRDKVEIGSNVIVMMGAIINIGTVIGAGSMVDMGAVLGARTVIGRNCHIGAGAVLAGVIEPPSSEPVVLGDDVVIGANAVVLEGYKIGKGAIVGAGAVVTSHVPENAVVVGVPARIIKMRDEVAEGKATIMECLRKL